MTLDAGFAALSHPLRRHMLAELAGGRRTISDFAGGAEMTFAAVSRHLRVLEEAGLVSRQVAGREHYFAAEPKALEAAKAWVDAQSARWQSSLDALKNLLESEMTDPNPLVALAEIHIAASPDRVFGAWVDKKLAAKFFAGEKMRVEGLRLDPRPGGELFVPMTDGKSLILHRGEFLLVDAPRRLVFTWISAHTQLRTTVVGIDFIGELGGTTVKLRHEGFEADKEASDHVGGWSSILRQLGTVSGAKAAA